jgi:hypothetical protein
LGWLRGGGIGHGAHGIGGATATRKSRNRTHPKILSLKKNFLR